MKVFIDKKNPKYEVVKYIEGQFVNLFAGDMELKDFYYSFENFGNFGFFYYYKPMDLMIMFLNERGIFEIRIERSDGVENEIGTVVANDPELCHIDLSSASIRDFSSIDVNMNILKKILEENRVKFYKVEGEYPNSKWIPVDD